MIRNWIQRYPFWSFYLLAVAIVAIVVAMRYSVAEDPPNYLAPLFPFIQEHGTYTNTVTIAWYAIVRDPLAFSVFVFAGAPTISAILVSFAGWGRKGIAQLFGRLKPWRNGVPAARGLAVYGVMAGVYLSIAGGYLVATWMLAGEAQLQATYAKLGGAPAIALATLLIGTLIDEGGTFEELGWRGYAQPVLSERFSSPLVVSAVLGTAWMLWHVPREVPGLVSADGNGTFSWGPYVWGQTQFLVLTISLSIVITFLYHQTGGSALPGILVHGGTNVWSKALAGPVYTATGVDTRTLIVLGMALAITFIAGPELGRSTGERNPQTEPRT